MFYLLPVFDEQLGEKLYLTWMDGTDVLAAEGEVTCSTSAVQIILPRFGRLGSLGVI